LDGVEQEKGFAPLRRSLPALDRSGLCVFWMALMASHFRFISHSLRSRPNSGNHLVDEAEVERSVKVRRTTNGPLEHRSCG
jgi:hypothetical protein